MVAVQFFLGFSLCALLILHTQGFPSKGSKSHGQSSSHQGDDFGPQGSTTGLYAPAPLYGASSQDGFPAGAFVPAYTAETLPAGYVAGGPGPSLPETKWTIAPETFSEEGLANTQTLDSSMLLPQNPAPSGPVLQSGETSNVVKEAELGNYQHETEEFGYPAASMGPGQGLPSYPMPYGGVFWASPYPYPASPYFDYRLLYGMYPTGTYTTFSKNNEKGKDYYQSIHYLKEHVPETHSTPDSGQQKKIFPKPPKNERS